MDLFSGIGGFSLAFESAGFRTIGFSEVEPFACQVLKKHWPEIPNYGDVTKWGEWPGLAVDVLTGGFPCQPFSQAGKRKGAADDRFLWPAMLDVVTRYRPTWVVGENVAGLINMELDRCFVDLENIGYEVQPFIIPACGVGAQHKRGRVWIVAYDNKMGFNGKPATDKENCGRYYVNSIKGVNTNRNGKNLLIEGFSTRLSKSNNYGIIHGLSSKLDCARLAALGNSIVPQIAQEIARCIYQISYA